MHPAARVIQHIRSQVFWSKLRCMVLWLQGLLFLAFVVFSVLVGFCNGSSLCSNLVYLSIDVLLFRGKKKKKEKMVQKLLPLSGALLQHQQANRNVIFILYESFLIYDKLNLECSFLVATGLVATGLLPFFYSSFWLRFFN